MLSNDMWKSIVWLLQGGTSEDVCADYTSYNPMGEPGTQGTAVITSECAVEISSISASSIASHHFFLLWKPITIYITYTFAQLIFP
jgi:hypothetical protein